eukprot:9492328-Pyramimonas_sp.AAC.1
MPLGPLGRFLEPSRPLWGPRVNESRVAGAHALSQSSRAVLCPWEEEQRTRTCSEASQQSAARRIGARTGWGSLL